MNAFSQCKLAKTNAAKKKRDDWKGVGGGGGRGRRGVKKRKTGK